MEQSIVSITVYGRGRRAKIDSGSEQKHAALMMTGGQTGGHSKTHVGAVSPSTPFNQEGNAE